MTAILASSIVLLSQAYTFIPDAVGTSVIGEKPTHIMGGQAVVLLPENMSMKQAQILNTAYEIAKADGHKDPQLVQGVLLQESGAGGGTYRVAGPSKEPYYGVGQIKVSAARDVMSAYPALWSKYSFQTKTDDELKAHLILNTVFNIEITSKYLRLLQIRYGFTGRELLNAYNRGPGGVKSIDNDEFHYAKGVEAKLGRNK
jgi:soluble lytic murein transglycosylase-like protein